MSDNNDTLVRVLEEIRDNQKLQLERQAEALQLQREQFVIFQKQAERASALHDRAEQIQDKGSQLVNAARKALAVVLPIIIILVLYLTWLIFR
jgi:hypothetical protein